MLLYTGRAGLVAPLDGLGVIDTGYEGSFVVLDRDIFTIDPDEIDQVQVAETWIRGERVYQRPAELISPAPTASPDRRQIESPLPDRS